MLERKIDRSSPLAIFCAAQNFQSGRSDHQRWPSIYSVALTVANFCLTVVNGRERSWSGDDFFHRSRTAQAKFWRCDRAFNRAFALVEQMLYLAQ